MASEILSPGAREEERIYEVLRNRALLKIREGTYSKVADLAKKFRGEYSTSIATSEIPASEKDTRSIQEKAQEIRDWLLQNGELKREEEFVTRRVQGDGWSASANIQVDETNIYFLFLSKDDPTRKVQTNLALLFDGTYELIIEYPRLIDKRKAQVRYETKGKRLEEMASNEAVISLDLLNGYLAHKAI
jgi:hypothetical protein